MITRKQIEAFLKSQNDIGNIDYDSNSSLVDELYIFCNKKRKTPMNQDADFDGDKYDRELDQPRLSGQLLAIYDIMKDGQWRTVDKLNVATGYPPNSIQAQLRNLRKPKFGSHFVESKRIQETGLFVYRLNLELSK